MLLRRHGRYKRWLLAASLGAGLSFGSGATLYNRFVIYAELPIDGMPRPVAVVVGSFDQSTRPPPPDCGCDARLPNVKCIETLTAEPAAIDDCWGEGRMRWIRLMLVLSYLLTTGATGALIGVVSAPRAERTVLPRPLPESADEKADVFVSHSSKDEAFATKLVSALRAGGASVFYAPESIRTSESFVERLDHALGGCRVGVLVWSSAAAKSPWVTKERNALIVRRVRGEAQIEVVRLEPHEVPPLLQDIHRIDAFPSPDAKKVAGQILTGFEPATTPPAADSDTHRPSGG